MFVLGTALTHVQDFGLGLVELHKVHTEPLLQPVQIPLDAIPSTQQIHHSGHVDKKVMDVGCTQCITNHPGENLASPFQLGSILEKSRLWCCKGRSRMEVDDFMPQG